VSLLANAGRLSAAWCNPKGRVVVTLILVQADDAIGLIVPANLADHVVKRLTMYRMRSKVDIGEPSDNWTSLLEAHDSDPAALIRAGIPTIDSSNTEQFTPHMLNLDKRTGSCCSNRKPGEKQTAIDVLRGRPGRY
jgi:folate-binding Fe-S cluster repair protein YgfZ